MSPLAHRVKLFVIPEVDLVSTDSLQIKPDRKPPDKGAPVCSKEVTEELCRAIISSAPGTFAL